MSVAEAFPVPRYRLFVPNDPNAALGMAVRMVMDHPAFAHRSFGEWSRVLQGQVKRGHQAFVANEVDQVVGFFGYSLTPRGLAEEWAAGRRALAFPDCIEGDCIIFNAWVAADRSVTRFMVEAARHLGHGRTSLYWRRAYPDGRARPVRLAVNAFVASHRARGGAPASPQDGPPRTTS